MDRWNIFLIILVFAIGWLSNDIFSAMDNEKPNVITSMIAYQGTEEKLSPQDIVKEDQIHIYQDRIVIDVENAAWAKFTDTNSMDPLFDQGTNALQIIPKNESQINVGDIISFTTTFEEGVIIHRVVEIGNDEQGWYAITKGDNNPSNDPGKVRFGQIRKLLIGIIY